MKKPPDPPWPFPSCLSPCPFQKTFLVLRLSLCSSLSLIKSLVWGLNQPICCGITRLTFRIDIQALHVLPPEDGRIWRRLCQKATKMSRRLRSVTHKADSLIGSILFAEPCSSHPSCLPDIQISLLPLSFLCFLVYFEPLCDCLLCIDWIASILWFKLLRNWFCLYMRCDSQPYFRNLWLLSQIWLIDLVLLGITSSVMNEDNCCTWVVGVLWVVVFNFKPADVCLPFSSVLALCYLTYIDAMKSVLSLKLLYLVTPLWLNCLHFGHFKYTLLIIMYWDWALYVWILCLLVCFPFQLHCHTIVRYLGLIGITFGSSGRILVPSFGHFAWPCYFFAYNLYRAVFVCPTWSFSIYWSSSASILWNVKRIMLLLDIKLHRKDCAHCSILIFANCDSTLMREEQLVVFLLGSSKGSSCTLVRLFLPFFSDDVRVLGNLWTPRAVFMLSYGLVLGFGWAYSLYQSNASGCSSSTKFWFFFWCTFCFRVSVLYFVPATNIFHQSFLSTLTIWMASEDQRCSYTPLVSQGLFIDCLWTRHCAAIFGILWNQDCYFARINSTWIWCYHGANWPAQPTDNATGQVDNCIVQGLDAVVMNNVHVFDYYAAVLYIADSFLVAHIDVIILCSHILYHDSVLASEDIGFLYLFPPTPLFRPPSGSEFVGLRTYMNTTLPILI